MAKSIFDGKEILVTGGTGSFGKRFIRRVLKDHKPKRVTVFSRDELKQSEMAEQFRGKRVRFLLGDIRELPRLQRAFHGIDIIIHAAALKQVPTLEYNPFEAVKTNIIGAEHVITAAIDQGVKLVVALSTDKAVNPVNLYGATKLCMEKLFIAGNAYAAGKGTRFSAVRYGNVLGSRGSVYHVFKNHRKSGRLPVTDKRMARFWITLDQGIDCVYFAAEHMTGGEVFVPKIPSMKVTDFAKVVAPGCKLEYMGIRPGEKLNEVLLTEIESTRTVDTGQNYVILPQAPGGEVLKWRGGGRMVPEGFRYASDSNDDWLTADKMKGLLQKI
ncbi:MAG: UDP-N-acetylglucosamine 4,6-dehydratase (inverting) [Elusimicrobiota bacterium]